MSHRVTVETKITNKEHAISALKAQNISFREQGNNLQLLSGDFNGASINLTTGVLTSGDTDHFRVDESKLGMIRRHYAEAATRAEIAIQGGNIQSTEEQKNGDIELMVQFG